MKRLLALTSAAVALMGVGLAESKADVFIGFQQAEVNGNALTTVASAPDFAVFAGGYGTYTINSVTVATRPATESLLASTALNVSSSTPGELFLFVSATDVDVSDASSIISGFTTNQLPPGWTASLSTFFDAGNAAYAMTTGIGNAMFSAIGTDVDSVLIDHDGLVSITGVFNLVSTGFGTALTTLRATSPVPEPTSLFLLGAGLLGLAGARRLIA